MPRMSYSGTTGTTVTYGITAADKSEDTAPTGTGVTSDIVGDVRTAYSVVVDDSKRGMTIDWYEGGEYIVSEEIPLDMLTPLAVVDGNVDEIKADYAKTGEAATAVATLNDFDPATDVVAHVTLVDTTTTNTDMRGTDGAMLAASYTAPPTAAQNADAVWDENPAGHTIGAKFGTYLGTTYQKVNGDIVSAANIADKVWDEVASGHLIAGTFGKRSFDMEVNTGITTPAAIAVIDGIVDDILVDTGTTIPAQIAATEAKVDIVDGILDTILPLIQRVYRYFFNKRTHTNSSVVVYADDGVTADATMTVTGDATTVTKDAPA